MQYTTFFREGSYIVNGDKVGVARANVVLHKLAATATAWNASWIIDHLNGIILIA